MKKYLFIFVTLISFSTFAQGEENINECMSDIYFANGINTSKEEAKIQLIDLVRKQVLISQFNRDQEKMNQTVNFKLAYNNTMGIAFDLLEAYGQKKAEHGTFWWTLGAFYDVYGGIAKVGLKYVTNELLEEMIVTQLKNTANQFIIDPLIDEAGLKDLASLMKDLKSGVSPSNVWATLMDSVAALENYDETKQLGSYKNSIKLGHSAIVIAHSQGNLFTNVVYEKIASSPEDKWMTKYFYMIGVASPAGKGTGPKGIEIVTFDNDPITTIPDSIGTPITNPMRYIVWDSDDNSRTSPCLNGFYPNGTVVSPCELGLDSGHPWFAFDNDIVDFHLFSYYMDTNISKTKIMNFVDTSIKAHGEAKSQWIQKEETDKNTCEHKITVKHKEDPSIEMPLEVYPFNASKKLYQVNGEYVKASCGGKNILDQWDGKKDNECLMIDNVEEEKIEMSRIIKFYAYYEFLKFPRPTWPYMHNEVLEVLYSTEINSTEQYNEYTSSGQRECLNKYNRYGRSGEGDYWYSTSDKYLEYIESYRLAQYNSNNKALNYTTICILDKNGFSLNDIERIEKGRVVYENYTSQNVFEYKKYFIEYLIYIH